MDTRQIRRLADAHDAELLTLLADEFEAGRIDRDIIRAQTGLDFEEPHFADDGEILSALLQAAEVRKIMALKSQNVALAINEFLGVIRGIVG